MTQRKFFQGLNARRGAAWLFCLVAATVAAAHARAAEPAPKASGAAQKPNIVLILADDLGYGDLGCFGQKRIQTPNLDRMAAEGMKLTDFYAGSTVCAPSRCVLMTGYHTGHALIRGNGKDNLRPEDVTVAEALKSAGYVCGLFGKWGLGHEGSAGLPTRQGFDAFYGYLDQHHAHNYYPTFLVRDENRVKLDNVVPGQGEFGQGVATEKRQYSDDLIVAEALAFIDRNKDKPFFLYLASTLPHANNEAGKAGMEIPSYGAYADKDWPEPQKGHAAMISRLDADVGSLLERLKHHGIDDRTLVLFSSDNGPHREGGNDPDFNESRGPLTGIKRSLTEGGIRVPTIARWPGKIAAGSRSHFVGGFQDILPTFAELAGAAADAYPADIDGISFAPTLLGQKQETKHEYLYWAFYEAGGGRAARMGNWKVVQQPIQAKPRLYRLDYDLGETHDWADKHPEALEKLMQAMDASYTPSARWQFPMPRQGGKKQ
ncbi:MAG: arylsulfatase [Planctomycetales bacterium]|nr:arylsulfatase [Planctomycetales bacterium]